MQKYAPRTYHLLGNLLAADEAHLLERRERQRQYWLRKKGKNQETVTTEEESEEAKDIFNDRMDEWEEEVDEETHEKNEQSRRQANVHIKQVMCLSIIMQSTNRNCNALQALIGLYLHSCGASDSVTEVVSHIGVSISITSIRRMIHNLSITHADDLKELGRSLLEGIGFDNVDIDTKHESSRLEDPTSTLVHLTSGTAIPLHMALPE
ncbi:hypothetical protein MPER_12341, partial [Moniliophthora perniciosa FA553]